MAKTSYAETRPKVQLLNVVVRYTRKSGETIIFVDLFGKIVKWIDHFKQVGDMAVQYDPVHAALLWAGIRFLLQVCDVGNNERYY